MNKDEEILIVEDEPELEIEEDVKLNDDFEVGFDDFDIEEEIDFEEPVEDEILTKTEDVDDEIEKTDVKEETKEEKTEIKTEETKKRLKNDVQRELEELYEQYHALRTEANQKRKDAGEYKKEMMRILEEEGIDLTIINGPDDLIEIGIEIKEEEVIDKRALAKAMGEGVKAKDLSNPQKMMEFFTKKLLTQDLIEEHTKINETELFVDRVYKPE